MKTPPVTAGLAKITAWAIIMNSAWRGYRYHTTRLNDVNGIGQAGLISIASPPAFRNTILPKKTTGCVRHINHTLNPGSDYARQPGPRRSERIDLPAQAGWDSLVPGHTVGKGRNYDKRRANG